MLSKRHTRNRTERFGNTCKYWQTKKQEKEREKRGYTKDIPFSHSQSQPNKPAVITVITTYSKAPESEKEKLFTVVNTNPAIFALPLAEAIVR